jgi:dihydroxyacetone kinase
MTFGKQLLNTVDHCVEDLVEGILLTNPHLSKVEGYNAVVRSDVALIKDREVTLISGGGSGHEPAHAGYIGDGMLSAAVLGNVFASPSVASILATIRAVAGAKGVILIVKNYTGDRLNFGIALELANQEGIKGKMVIVDDDCALPEGKGITGGRGIAGTVLIHKIAGACAKLGYTLDEVHAIATRAVQATRTLGVALTTCTVPGTTPSSRLDGAQSIEIGMGIHGESGREQATLPTENASKYIAQVLVDGVLARSSINLSADDKVAVLINNLGTLSVLELNVVSRDMIHALVAQHINPVKIYVGSFMTSLDMNGISLSLLKIPANDSQFLNLLDAQTSAPAWHHSQTFDSGDFNIKQRVIKGASIERKSLVCSALKCDHLPVKLCQTISSRIMEIEPLLSEYDSICGDGDCGIVMKKGAMRLIEEMLVYQDAESIDPAEFCDRIASALSHSMGGTSGGLLELAFRRMSNYFQVNHHYNLFYFLNYGKLIRL